MRYLTASIKIGLIFTCLLSLLAAAPAIAFESKVNGVRIWPSPDSTRVVFDLSSPVKYNVFTLKNPNRLVVDLSNTKLSTSLKGAAEDKTRLRKIRTSKPPKNRDLRIVMELDDNIDHMAFALRPTGHHSDRLVIDLLDKTETVAKAQRKIEADRDLIIAIDAGHGGEDPGSIGPRGTYEKNVTLTIAKKLANQINKEKGFKAVLTRTGDYFVDIGRRSDKARKAYADLLISIHADAYTSPRPSGASVWVLTMRRAETEIGRFLEDKEKHSQLLGGAAEAIKNTNNERYLVQALIDMSMDHTINQGFTVASEVLKELGKITKLHKRKTQKGNFGVLKSPDIPSILVETGFISNPKEENLLTNSWYQNRLATSLTKAVKRYFSKYAPEDTLYAKLHRKRKHKVQPGESLSIVAQTYQVSVQKIKSVNKLKSDMIRVGQVLTIPRS
jgi:N-acetylmuramoyl-L-alanine amidase